MLDFLSILLECIVGKATEIFVCIKNPVLRFIVEIIVMLVICAFVILIFCLIVDLVHLIRGT